MILWQDKIRFVLFQAFAKSDDTIDNDSFKKFDTLLAHLQSSRSIPCTGEKIIEDRCQSIIVEHIINYLVHATLSACNKPKYPINTCPIKAASDTTALMDTYSRLPRTGEDIKILKEHTVRHMSPLKIDNIHRFTTIKPGLGSKRKCVTSLDVTRSKNVSKTPSFEVLSKIHKEAECSDNFLDYLI